MAKKDEAKDSEVTLESLAKQVNDLAAWRRKVSENWKRFCAKYVGGDATDGKVGSVRLNVLVSVLMVSIAIVAFATDVSHLAGDKAHWGPAAIRSDGAFASSGQMDISGALTVGGAISASGVIDGTSIMGSATNPIATVTAVDTDYGNLRQRVITLANVPVVMTDRANGTNSFGGTKIQDFAAGYLDIDAIMVNLTCATNAQTLSTNLVSYALGTAVATHSNLVSTFADFVGTNGIQTQITNYFKIVSTNKYFDGTTTAIDMYLNVVRSDDQQANTTNLINGTIDLWFKNLGPY